MGATVVTGATLSAIARLVVRDGIETIHQGTGFLVTPELILTALHVAFDRKAKPVKAWGSTIIAQFPDHETEVVPLEGRYDSKDDWVLLRCLYPPQINPLLLQSAAFEDDHWKT